MTTVSKFGREVPKEIGATSQSGAHRTPRNKSQESTQDEIVSVKVTMHERKRLIDGSCQQKISSELGCCCIGNKV